ncbi:MAG TPA: class I SAM-dependent rRNA methyltransferase [Candidatus Acidoferrales bacterium]|nr:class I SAM-dependent rRNA methyltransferase [Candidatus Acidoferrales bacterium]
MAEAVVRLKPGRERSVRTGHPWIFSGALDGADPALEPGDVVTVLAADGAFLGRGYVNPRCAIAVRLLTHADETIDGDFLQRRVASAYALRRAVLPPSTDAYRLINGEGDLLPGFVADVYGGVVVLQCLTAGAARQQASWIAALQSVIAPQTIYERSGGAVRREEGLAPSEGVLSGSLPEGLLEISENGLRFLVDVRAGQKTGFFLDQRDNRQLAQSLAAGRRVLNAFSYTGAFGVYAASGSARQVVSVDSSAPALDIARRIWTLNNLRTETSFMEADVFRFLRDTDSRFDLLILDPPALVKRRQEVDRGARAYKDLHLNAFRCAKPGALALTFSCSQHVSAELFCKIVQGAAVDARREVQVLRHLGAGADHPIHAAHPEGEYLSGLLLRIM